MEHYIMSTVRGFKIQFSQTPFHSGTPQITRVNQKDRLQTYISELRNTGNTEERFNSAGIFHGEFLSNLFFVNKKGDSHRPVIKPNHLNSFISHQPFRMEGIHLIKDLLQETDYLMKID